MSTKPPRLKVLRRHASVLPTPAVATVIEGLGPERAALAAQLREATLALSSVEERTLYDGFCREWTPAFYVRSRQLFHLHSFRSGLRATMFVSTKELDLAAAACHLLPGQSSQALSATVGRGRVGQIKVGLSSAGDVALFLELVRAKWSMLSSEQP